MAGHWEIVRNVFVEYSIPFLFCFQFQYHPPCPRGSSSPPPPPPPAPSSEKIVKTFVQRQQPLQQPLQQHQQHLQHAMATTVTYVQSDAAKLPPATDTASRRRGSFTVATAALTDLFDKLRQEEVEPEEGGGANRKAKKKSGEPIRSTMLIRSVQKVGGPSWLVFISNARN